MSNQLPAGIEDDVALALEGQGDALERVLEAVEPQIFGLAMRMLGHRDDALDATQEILLRVATHLSEFRGDSRFSTWTYRVAANALLDVKRDARRSRERSFTDIAADLERGVDAFERLPEHADRVTPEDKAVAAELALLCTQGMLMALDRRHRLAYILGEALDISSGEGAAIAQTTPAAFRQQLSRARKELREFMSAHCGIVNSDARCTCTKQMVAAGPRTIAFLERKPLSNGDAMPLLQDAAARAGLKEAKQLLSAIRVFRAHPQYGAGGDISARIRARIAATVFGRQ